MANQRRLIKSKGPVYKLDRTAKARMINAFLEDYSGQKLQQKKILDIGSGNGQISSFFANRGNNVHSVDIEDKRDVNNTDKNVKFTIVTNETLPFQDNSFDIVISHHVIEHVENQITHLEEIRRTLKNDGLAYLGCPNRSSPFMAGHLGNDKVLDHNEANILFELCKLQPIDYYSRFLAEPKKFYCNLKIGKYIPISLIRALKRYHPGMCYILKKLV